ncbi:hypothetical protein JQM84_05890 [Parabacteroides distasonis]|nr:hypothetical protein [Parabacteroides distasonis]
MSDIKLFSYLDNGSLSKETMQIQSRTLIQPIIDGEIDPLRAVANIRFLSDMLTAALKDDRVKDIVLGEIDKNGGKEATAFGVKFTQKEMGVSYDYTVCGDPEYDRLAAEMEDLKARMKDREKFLMGIPAEGLPMVDQETGDCYKIIRPLRRASLNYSVTFKK